MSGTEKWVRTEITSGRTQSPGPCDYGMTPYCSPLSHGAPQFIPDFDTMSAQTLCHQGFRLGHWD